MPSGESELSTFECLGDYVGRSRDWHDEMASVPAADSRLLVGEVREKRWIHYLPISPYPTSRS